MPQLGETVTEGTITRWMKNVGDTVARDEPLFEVSTDKVDSEVPSPAAGVLQEILVPEGETVDVGVRLAVIGEAALAGSPAPADAPAEVAPPAAPPPPPAPAAPPPAAPAPPPAAAAPPAPPSAAAPPPAPTVAAEPVQPAPVAPAPPAPAPAAAVPPAASAEPTLTPPPPPPGFATTTQPVPVPEATDGDDPRLLSPVVRRLLSENGIAASEITGTGVGGRITREDVLAEIDARRAGSVPAEPPKLVVDAVAAAPPPVAPPVAATAPPPPAPAAPAAPLPAAPPPAAPAPVPPAPAPVPPAPPPAATPPPPAVAAVPGAPTTPPTPPVPARPSMAPNPVQPASPVLRPTGDQIIPFSNMRRRTAEHMLRSKATSPHAYIATEADFENVERVRRQFGERFRAEEGFSLTYLPFIARAMVEALRDYPRLNASVAEESLVVHQEINLGIAVDLEHEGLIVPVVHRAEEVTLRGMARRIRDLADRARTRQLRADDIAGGTISVTNDGPFGTYFTVPIINQPQVAILATDGVRRRPVVVTLPDGTESIAIHSTGNIGISWDHRAVDGAYVASFLGRVAELLTTREWTSEL